jgi:NAD(P)-dependent dehydrogenase (short-subunit alcohol dehydrogenase family)
MVLSGRKAVVTGGARGIGRAIAERLRDCGAEVTITARSATAGVLQNCACRQAELSSLDGIEAFAFVLDGLKPDILINNAGINRVASVDEIGLEEFVRIQTVNVVAPFRLSQAVLPAMKARGWGRIVNLGSIWGKIGKELRVPYSTSKFALAGFSAALAAEVTGQGILVNCVSPGPIETEMTRQNLTGGLLDQLLAVVPAGRLGTPAEVAELVVWLASDSNTFVSGQNIAIDGGFSRV